MIDEIREFLNTEDINEENCLEFLLNNKSQASDLIIRYICSQLQVKFHFYGYTKYGLDYQGECDEPLLQIVKGQNPFLMKKLIALYESFDYKHLTEEDIVLELSNGIRMKGNLCSSKSDGICKMLYEIPSQIGALRKKLDNVPKYKFWERNKIIKQISVLEANKKKIKEYVYHFEPQGKAISDKEREQKELEWQSFLDKNIEIMKQNLESKDASEIAEYLIIKGEIKSVVETLKRDIILQYKLLQVAFNSNINTKTLKETLDEIRSVFNNYDGPERLAYSDNTVYRDTDLLVPLNDSFFAASSKGAMVQTDMDKLELEFEKLKKIDNREEYIKKAIELFQKFIVIHPYKDGNGRTSRYLLYMMLINRGIVPPVLYDTYMQRHKLDKLSNEYINGNTEDLNNYIMDLIFQNHSNDFSGDSLVDDKNKTGIQR